MPEKAEQERRRQRRRLVNELEIAISRWILVVMLVIREGSTWASRGPIRKNTRRRRKRREAVNLKRRGDLMPEDENPLGRREGGELQ